MRAMVLHTLNTPLRETELPVIRPAAGQVLVRVSACAVLRNGKLQGAAVLLVD
ncbi:MAG TPA: hypothetical protein VKJ65_10875 [Phycisphaerae bacterium]|nr:hypothetical protein [Phycisphaerae bacterium]